MVNMLEVLVAGFCEAKGITIPERRAVPRGEQSISHTSRSLSK